MEGSHHVNGNSIIFKKGGIYRTKIERSSLTAKGFNTSLVQLLLLYNISINNFHASSITCTISHLERHAPKTVLHARNLLYKNL